MTQTRKSFQDRSNRNTAACGVLHSQPLESFPNTLSNCLHLWSPWDVMEQSDRDQQGTSTRKFFFSQENVKFAKKKKASTVNKTMQTVLQSQRYLTETIARALPKITHTLHLLDVCLYLLWDTPHQ